MISFTVSVLILEVRYLPSEKIQMIWIKEILKYHAAIQKAEPRGCCRWNDGLWCSVKSIFSLIKVDQVKPVGETQVCCCWGATSEGVFIPSRAHEGPCYVREQLGFPNHIIPAASDIWLSMFCCAKLTLQSREVKCDNPECAKQI